jgi:hypothetical protein
MLATLAGLSGALASRDAVGVGGIEEAGIGIGMVCVDIARAPDLQAGALKPQLERDLVDHSEADERSECKADDNRNEVYIDRQPVTGVCLGGLVDVRIRHKAPGTSGAVDPDSG